MKNGPSYELGPSFFYPAICRAVRSPPQNAAKAKKLGEGSTARKCPIGSTNNHWGMKPPTD
ncbi:hypothetical protein COL93_00560 [Bacillus toyonensis]|uniref:Spermidine/putrescine ABC transporter ATP-binding protein n=1 Tax=Bacillus toyonensis TaxID=155322 RepID=A0A2B5Y9Q7_9BACI|nr:hypothetical protein COL93_00560 [Bacillus toyonensis]PHD70855.1 hypothetical protein COF40_10135 [Bacillus toyonensis]